MNADMGDLDPHEFYNRQKDTDASTSDYSTYVDKSLPYKWMLLNKGNRNLQVRSDTPCFRVLGFFNTKKDAKRHCGRFESDVMDIYMYETNKFLPITIERNVSPDAEDVIVADVTQRYRDRKATNTRTFADNVKNKKMGDIPKSIQSLKNQQTRAGAVAEEEEDSDSENDDKELSESARRLELTVSHEVRNQRFVVWSYMEDKDIGEDPEQPIVRFHAALEDEATAVYHVKFLSQKIIDVNLIVSPMYEWVHISAAILNDTSIPSEYRNKKLNEIMQRKAASQQQVAAYVNTCKESNVEPTYKDLFNPDLGKTCVADDHALSA